MASLTRRFQRSSPSLETAPPSHSSLRSPSQNVSTPGRARSAIRARRSPVRLDRVALTCNFKQVAREKQGRSALRAIQPRRVGRGAATSGAGRGDARWGARCRSTPRGSPLHRPGVRASSRTGRATTCVTLWRPYPTPLPIIPALPPAGVRRGLRLSTVWSLGFAVYGSESTVRGQGYSLPAV